MGYSDALKKRIQEDVDKYGGRFQLEKASEMEILAVRHLSPEHLHANPDDDFSNPEVGPNEEIVEKYIEEAERDMQMGAESFEEPIMVAKLEEEEEYMIVNGHHRWAAAMKLGLERVHVAVVNPGWENLTNLFQ